MRTTSHITGQVVPLPDPAPASGISQADSQMISGGPAGSAGHAQILGHAGTTR